MIVLKINELEKSYKYVKALKGVSLSVPEGSVFGILGPNGSGKTTLLGILLNVLAADKGTFEWFGHSSDHQYRKKIGSLLETPNFYHYLSAKNNLLITQSISGRGNAEEIDQILQTVNLHEWKNKKFSTYSLGMKQRLAIAAALLGQPKVLVLDEPTNGLDPVGIAEIRTLIQDLSRKGHTVIIASHLLDEIEKVCTHVAILKKGELVVSGPVHDVLAQEDIVELSANDIPSLKQIIKEITGVREIVSSEHFVQLYFQKDQADLSSINRFCYERGIILNHLMLKRKRLEEKFFELTSKP
jgi:ABC-2 type transport system ATP-binding protein